MTKLRNIDRRLAEIEEYLDYAAKYFDRATYLSAENDIRAMEIEREMILRGEMK